MKSTRELIAAELRSIRAKDKYSIEEVAKKTSINKDTICRYENNLVSMNIEILEKLLAFYNIDFDIFFKNIYANKHKKGENNEEKESN